MLCHKMDIAKSNDDAYSTKRAANITEVADVEECYWWILKGGSRMYSRDD